MIYSYADVRNLAAAATTNNVLTVGVPTGEVWKLLEIRTPVSVVALLRTDIYIDGIQRFQLVPSINDNVIVVDEEYQEGAQIAVNQVKSDATSQNVGVILVIDRQVK